MASLVLTLPTPRMTLSNACMRSASAACWAGDELRRMPRLNDLENSIVSTSTSMRICRRFGPGVLNACAVVVALRVR